MAPCRQLLMWSVPSIAVLLGIFWFRKKREFAKSDPGGRLRVKSLQEELAEALNAEAEVMRASPLGKADHSIIKSAPIDILPNGIGSQRSSPLVLTDEEVDIEIEKIIRKKSVSISNDKRMSANIDEYGSVVSTKQPSFTVSSAIKTPLSESFNINESGSVCLIKSSSASIEDTKTNADTNNLQDAPSEGSKTNETQNESTEEQMEATQGELNNNNVEAAGDSNEINRSQFSTAPRRLLSERDFANHSPVDPLLASPSLCHFSDSHSEGSSDSGKGCSEAASPPPANMVSPEAGLRIYQFIIPQSLVGLLIGKHGSFVTQIKAKTGASVYVRRHPESTKQKICAVEGSSAELEAALDMIREKFPEKRFPNFCIEEISAELYQKLVPLVPEFLPLQLVESVNNETIMTCLVSAGHFFLQQPLHPTFPALHALHRLMASTYQEPAAPPLPRPVSEGSICAAPTENNWYRAQVVSTCEEKDSSVVKLVDFGGYLTVDNDQLKQIRSDFMALPFQATEALLAFVKPANSAAEWGAEALRIMAGLTAGQLLHAQVAGYDEAGLPLVNLYLTIGAQQVIFLNRELVERGLAEWELPADA